MPEWFDERNLNIEELQNDLHPILKKSRNELEASKEDPPKPFNSLAELDEANVKKNENNLSEEEIKRIPEWILFHNVIWTEIPKGEPVNFFAGKSSATRLINDALGKNLRQVPGWPKLGKECLKRAAELKEKRDHSFFLTKEDEQFHGYGLISFDIRKLLEKGFKITEGNHETADRLNTLKPRLIDIINYLDSLRDINSSADLLKYDEEVADDYERCASRVIFKPYLPEYMIEAPSSEFINQWIHNHSSEIQKIISEYRIIPPYSKMLNYKNEEKVLITNENLNFEKADNINLSQVDLGNVNDYHLVVSVLFNSSIININPMDKNPSAF